MYQKITLDNGLRLVIGEMPHTRSASVAVFMGIGSRYEQAAESGVSHYIEHMLFKGTQKRPTGKEISEAIEGIGGVLNAESGKEMTVFWAKVPAAQLSLAVDVLADILLWSEFRDEDIERERLVILEELNMLRDVPQELVDILFDEVMWDNQPMGRDIAGSRETVTGLTKEDILNYYRSHYTPANTVVSVASPFTAPIVNKMVRDKFGDWASPSGPAISPPNATTAGPKLKVECKTTEQVHLCLGVPGYSYVHPDRFALDLLNVILGEGMSSRLFQEIREKRGLAYDVQSYVHHYSDTGSVVIYAGVEPKQTEDTIKAILEQLAKLKEPISENEVTKAREMWKGRMILRLEDTRAISSWIGTQELLLNQILTVDDIIKIINGVQLDQVNRIAKDLFQTERLHLSLVGPFKDKDHFARLMQI